jgi:hypothetical protein
MRFFKNITIVASFFLIAFLLFFFLKKGKEDSLKGKRQNVKMAWNAFRSDLTIRDSLTMFFATKFDSLKYFVQQSKLQRDKDESNLNLEYDEYKINYLLANFSDQKSLLGLYNKLNNDLEKYNSETKDYNDYISMFPNFIVAKTLDYKKAKYFTIKYGAINDDPISKSKELPEWVNGVDTN